MSCLNRWIPDAIEGKPNADITFADKCLFQRIHFHFVLHFILICSIPTGPKL